MTKSPRSRNAAIVDPGGVRGIHSLVSMARVAQKTGKPIHEMYDLYAGTSVGIIALALLLLPDPNNPGKPKYTPDQAIDIFEQFAKVVFPPPTRLGTLRQLFSHRAKHSAKGYEEALEKIFGDVRVDELLGNVMFYVTEGHSQGVMCIHNIKKDDGTVYSKYRSRMRVRDVIRGGTTAPTFHEMRWDYPVDPDDKNSRKIGMKDGGNAAGNVPYEVDKTLESMSPPGTRRILSHFRNGRSKHKRPETIKLPLLGGLLGYILYDDQREGYMTWTFNSPNNRTSKIFELFHPENYQAFEATIDKRQNPEHPTMRLDGADAENMRRHRVRMNERLDEMEKDKSLGRHCDALMEKFRVPEPEIAAESEKSGLIWKRPETAEMLRGFGVSLVGAWEKTRKTVAKAVNENIIPLQKPKPPERKR